MKVLLKVVERTGRIEIEIETSSEAQIINLKSVVANSLPSNPDPSLQRAIFKGRELKDDERLSDVISPGVSLGAFAFSSGPDFSFFFSYRVLSQ